MTATACSAAGSRPISPRRGRGDSCGDAGEAARRRRLQCGHLWEHSAFHESYDFSRIDDAETERIITVNLTSAITCIRALLPNFRKAAGAKLIFIGSTSGLDNSSGREVAYAASKFGLRGATHALRENLRADGIAVTCLNPGNIGTIRVERGVVSAAPHEDRAMIPPQDLVAIVKCVIGLSNGSCVKEIDVMAMTDSV